MRMNIMMLQIVLIASIISIVDVDCDVVLAVLEV